MSRATKGDKTVDAGHDAGDLNVFYIVRGILGVNRSLVSSVR